jgi:hypothetical protein
MSDPTTIVLGGIVVSVLSAFVGKIIGSRGKVSDEQCGERRRACNALVLEKLSHLEDLIKKNGVH